MDLGNVFDGIGIMATAWDTYGKYDALSSKYRSDATVYAHDYDLDMKSAQDARDRGVRSVTAIRRKGKILGGKQMSAMGASGVEAGSGSFSKVLQDTRDFTQEDADTTWENAMRDAYGYEISAKNARNRANAAGQQADDASDNALIGAIGSIASGIASWF